MKKRHIMWLLTFILVFSLSVLSVHGRSIEDDPGYRSFSGLSETDVVNSQELERRRKNYCSNMTRTIWQFPDIDYSWPQLDGKPLPKAPYDERKWHYSGGLHDGSPFEQLMIHAVDPDSQKNNPYVRITAPYMDKLKQRILASPNRLTPADVMREALEVTGGNYRLATLTAHNLFKNITYQGRRRSGYDRGRISAGRTNVKFPSEYGNFADKLVNLRPTPQTGVGRTDKMGIWYHSFVPMSIAAWTGNADQADLAIDQEYLVRSLGGLTNMGSPVDPDKKASDLCFASAATAVQNSIDGVHIPVPHPTPTPTSTPAPVPAPAPAPVPTPTMHPVPASSTPTANNDRKHSDCNNDMGDTLRLEKEYQRAFTAGNFERLKQLQQEREALQQKSDNCQ